MVLGHQTYLKGKPGGESSMSGKPRCLEPAKGHVRQDPDGKMKAELPEPQCPNRNLSSREGRMALSRFRNGGNLRVAGETKEEAERHDPVVLREPPIVSLLEGVALQENWTVSNGLNKDTKRASKPSYRQPHAECVIAYKPRGSWQRSLHSSLRTGKPATWRRETGMIRGKP
jgi:hypothetical protein